MKTIFHVSDTLNAAYKKLIAHLMIDMLTTSEAANYSTISADSLNFNGINTYK